MGSLSSVLCWCVVRSDPDDLDVISYTEAGNMPHNWGPVKTYEISSRFMAHGRLSGREHMLNAALNDNLMFTIRQRQALRIHGLLPTTVRTREQAIYVCRMNLKRLSGDVSKYHYLSLLRRTNERLFYRVMFEQLPVLLPLLGTPNIGNVCKTYGNIFRMPVGLFVTLRDKGQVARLLHNWPERDVRAVCVTNGQSVPGMGDQGAHAMPVATRASMLMTIVARVRPHQVLSVMLDVGTDNLELMVDAHYLGLRQRRTTSGVQDELLNELMTGIVYHWGPSTLVLFTGFGKMQEVKLKKQYSRDYCIHLDDLQGIGATVLAGILASLRVSKLRLTELRLLLVGSGQAGAGIADMFVVALQNEGIPLKEAQLQVWMMNRKGLVTAARPSNVSAYVRHRYAQQHGGCRTVLEAVKTARPQVLIATCSVFRIITPQVLMEMASVTERPLIMALSDPISRAECTADEAYVCTNGSCLFASGPLFGTTVFRGRKYETSQCKTFYLAPALALAATSCGLYRLTDEMYLTAARELSRQATREELASGRLFPALERLHESSLNVAASVVKRAYELRLATFLPAPMNVVTFLHNQVYDPDRSIVFEQWRRKTSRPSKLKATSEKKATSAKRQRRISKVADSSSVLNCIPLLDGRKD